MLSRIEERDPAALEPLVQRIISQAFPHIVLQFDVEDPASGVAVGPHELGPSVDGAIRAAYRLDGIIRTPSVSYSFQAPEFYVYVPR
jgi:hypothetical protein